MANLIVFERQGGGKSDGRLSYTIPAGVKHRHGAKKNSRFSHLAVEVPGVNCSTGGCEPVSDEEYFKL